MLSDKILVDKSTTGVVYLQRYAEAFRKMFETFAPSQDMYDQCHRQHVGKPDGVHGSPTSVTQNQSNSRSGTPTKRTWYKKPSLSEIDAFPHVKGEETNLEEAQVREQQCDQEDQCDEPEPKAEIAAMTDGQVEPRACHTEMLGAPGSCKNGTNCRYSHAPSVLQKARQEYIQAWNGQMAKPDALNTTPGPRIARPGSTYVEKPLR